VAYWVVGVIGFIFGWRVGHPFLGVCAGMLFGGLLSEYWKAQFPGSTRGAPRGFIEPLFAYLGALTKADGWVSEAEIAATEQLMQRMRLTAQQREVAIKRFTAGKQPDFAVTQSIIEMRAWCQGRRDHAYILIDLVLDILGVDGPPVPPKLQLLRTLAAALSIHEREWIALAAMKGYVWATPSASRQRHAPPPRQDVSVGPDPYAVLGITRDTGEREIKRAYRKLISEHHPDKLGDVPDSLRQRAEERAREINAAYERVKAAKGFK